MITKYLLHWNAIIYLWYLAKNDLLSSRLLNSDQSKAHQSRTGMKGTMKEQRSLLCLLSVLSQQMLEGGWGQGQKKRERNADSWKECVNRRISLLAGPLCTVRESVCRRCWAPSVPAALALSHYSVSTTRRRVISHTCFNRQDRKMQEIYPTPCELTETLAPHRRPTVLVGAQPYFVHRGNKNLRSVVELLMSPHTRSLPGQSAPCRHIFSSTQQEWPPDWVGTGGKASQHAANPSHSSSRLSATIGLSDWSGDFTG